MQQFLPRHGNGKRHFVRRRFRLYNWNILNQVVAIIINLSGNSRDNRPARRFRRGRVDQLTNENRGVASHGCVRLCEDALEPVDCKIPSSLCDSCPLQGLRISRHSKTQGAALHRTRGHSHCGSSLGDLLCYLLIDLSRLHLHSINY